ncbi:GNAT family N-acetyltransferase [Weeksellaceae bacterium TAE3-ERU29]|nr:GNAT family N-acetyltransferase [Weeksellaceae bacterium TAE3-ERU29]
MDIYLKSLNNSHKEELHMIYKAYCNAFPEDERRNEFQFWELLENPAVYINSIEDDKEKFGYIIIWQLSSAVFVEHFEVFPKFRGKAIGGKLLSYLLDKFPIVILESEPDFFNITAERRINFYKRNGFIILDKDYIQPAYSENKKPLNLYLMGNKIPENLKVLKREIKEIVYR